MLVSSRKRLTMGLESLKTNLSMHLITWTLGFALSSVLLGIPLKNWPLLMVLSFASVHLFALVLYSTSLYQNSAKSAQKTQSEPGKSSQDRCRQCTRGNTYSLKARLRDQRDTSTTCANVHLHRAIQVKHLVPWTSSHTSFLSTRSLPIHF